MASTCGRSSTTATCPTCSSCRTRSRARSPTSFSWCWTASRNHGWWREATDNPEAYRLYLRASELLHKRDYEHAGDAIEWLEQAVALDPKFARARSQLALVQMVLNIRDPKRTAEAERHARAAMAMDPQLAQPVYVLGLTLRYARRWAESRPYFDRAVQMAPRDAVGAHVPGAMAARHRLYEARHRGTGPRDRDRSDAAECGQLAWLSVSVRRRHRQRAGPVRANRRTRPVAGEVGPGRGPGTPRQPARSPAVACRGTEPGDDPLRWRGTRPIRNAACGHRSAAMRARRRARWHSSINAWPRSPTKRRRGR